MGIDAMPPLWVFVVGLIVIVIAALLYVCYRNGWEKL